MADEEEVKSPAEETTPESETEIPEPEAEPEVEEPDTPKNYQKIAEDQRKRAEKAEQELKKFKTPKGPVSPRALSSEDRKRLDRIELNSVGIKDREEQDFVLSAAKRLGVDPSEAANDSIITARLERMRELKASKDATPAPSKGGGGSTKASKLPDFSKMSDKEFDEYRRASR